jgi:excisionase family DNA binding protein
MTDLIPLAMSVSEAVRVSGLGKTSLYAAIAAGKIRIKKAGRRTLVETAELRRFIDNLPTSRVENTP